jgi:hypothetical protein
MVVIRGWVLESGNFGVGVQSLYNNNNNNNCK